MIKKIALLGSTGSIGLSTLDVIRRHPDRFEVAGLVGGSKIDVLIEQIREFKPEYVAVKEEKDALELSKKISQVEVLHGEQGAAFIAGLPEVDCVISAIVGAAGLIPTLAALKAGKIVGLANKESMVIAGEIMQKVALENGATVLPVDSEHSALFQCLHGEKKESIRRLILTASGGPFFKKPVHEFSQITLAEALKHPNWNMGPKITIDSATMMNKGLEVMEARWLFDIEVDKIEICVHPQSIVHSMVDYIDGSVIAHLGMPDMRVPIAYALSYPERIETGVKPLNLFEKKELTFFAPDFEKFPCLRIAYEVAKKGQTYPAVLNAANEVVVEAFLNQKIGFTKIPQLIESVLGEHRSTPLENLQTILAADAWARVQAQGLIQAL